MKDIIRDLAGRDQHNLKLRFQVGLGIILFCFCLFTTTIIYHFQKSLLEEETFRQTEVLMTSLESTRSYIREVLRPRMWEELGEDQFIIEAMSTSYITRVIMDRFEDVLPAFRYRRTAIDARNPRFEANRQEREMIEYFRAHPDEQDWIEDSTARPMKLGALFLFPSHWRRVLLRYGRDHFACSVQS
jgi:hypothetical protein